jgi:hypothetical protein
VNNKTRTPLEFGGVLVYSKLRFKGYIVFDALIPSIHAVLLVRGAGDGGEWVGVTRGAGVHREAFWEGKGRCIHHEGHDGTSRARLF